MKQHRNYFLFLFSTLIYSSVFAQIVPVDDETGKIMYRDVVEEEGGKQDFFIRAVEWINGYYPNPFQVTKTRDADTGEIEGLHRFKITNTLDDGTEADAGVIQYEFLLQFKEGRYRYTLTNFILRQASKVPVEKWLDKDDPLYDVRWESYLKQIDDFAKNWIKSLKEGMKPEVKHEEEEW